MHAFGPKGLFLHLLHLVVRLVQSNAVSAPRRFTIIAAVATSLFALAWIGANLFVAQAGEVAGTAAYDRLLFSYLMRLVCGESLVIGGLFLSALWAQQAGRIPQYSTPADERE